MQPLGQQAIKPQTKEAENKDTKNSTPTKTGDAHTQ